MIVKEMSNKQDLKKLLKKMCENLLDPEKIFSSTQQYVAAYLSIIKY